MGLEETIANTSVNILIGATILLGIFAGISLHIKHLKEGMKKFLFGGILAVAVIPTLYMSIATIYLNSVSASGGPVHWHADIELWSCGKEINLKDPVGTFSNKIGTPTLHEHNDKRIHLEGVVVHPEDASLGKFFRVIGGELTQTSVIIPTNEGAMNLTNGSMCPNGQEGQVQVFVYQTDKENYYTQTKLPNPQQHLIAPHSGVPPGDCIVVEFGTPKERTDKICRSFKVAEKIGKLKGERK